MKETETNRLPSIREVTRTNLQRVLDEERISPAELARRYGCPRQSIQTFLDYGFGEKVAEQLARALERPWYDFYKLDFMLKNLSGVPNDIIQLLLDVRKIMERGDQFLTRLIKENVKFMLEYVSQQENKEMLEKRVQTLEQKVGIPEDAEPQGPPTGPAKSPLVGRKRARSG